MESALAAAVTAYGVAGALASLLQLRAMRRRRSSQDVSLAYLSVIGGGYLLWLAYGVAIGNLPLILVDALGGGAMLATLLAAVKLRRRAGRRSPPSLAKRLGSGRGAWRLSS